MKLLMQLFHQLRLLVSLRCLITRVKDLYGTNQCRAIILTPTARHVTPYCLYYFCDLRNWELDSPLPGDCDSLLCDYLEALIAVQNTKREREAYLLSGMTEAAQTLPSEMELRQRVSELEVAMEDNKAIVPPASMF